MTASTKQATLHRGYLYIFRKHVCFKGLVQEVFPYSAVSDIEKKNFAKIISNAIVIVVKRNGKKTKVRKQLLTFTNYSIFIIFYFFFFFCIYTKYHVIHTISNTNLFLQHMFTDFEDRDEAFETLYAQWSKHKK